MTRESNLAITPAVRPVQNLKRGINDSVIGTLPMELPARLAPARPQLSPLVMRGVRQTEALPQIRGAAFDARYIVNQSSGIGQMGLELLRALESLWAHDPLTVLVNPSTPLPSELQASERLTILSVPWSPYGIRNQLLLPRLLRNHNIRLLHSVDSHHPLISTSIHQILHIHDVIPLICDPELIHSLKAKFRFLWRSWLKLQCSRATRVVTGSQYAAEQILQELNLAPEKIEIIPAPIRRWSEEVVGHELRDTIRMGKVVISHVGRQEPYKNVLSLIRALPMVMESIGTRDISVILSGSVGPGCSEITEEIAKLHLKDQVHCAGYLTEEALGELYSLSDVFVFPSLHEGFGMPPLEAMRFGAPVVASNRSCLPEVLGRAAVMVDPLDPSAIAAAITHILTDPELALRLTEAGYAQVARYNSYNIARRYMRLYQAILHQTN